MNFVRVDHGQTVDFSIVTMLAGLFFLLKDKTT